MSAVRHSTAKCIWECHNSQMPDVTLWGHCISCLQQAQKLLLFRQTLNGLYPPLFRRTAAVNFIQQPVQTGSTEYLVLKFPSQSPKAKSGLLNWVAPLCIINVTRLELTDVFTTKRRWTVPKLMQTATGLLMWAVKRGLTVAWCLAHSVYLWSTKNRETNRGTWQATRRQKQIGREMGF